MAINGELGHMVLVRSLPVARRVEPLVKRALDRVGEAIIGVGVLVKGFVGCE